MDNIFPEIAVYFVDNVRPLIYLNLLMRSLLSSAALKFIHAYDEDVVADLLHNFTTPL